MIIGTIDTADNLLIKKFSEEDKLTHKQDIRKDRNGNDLPSARRVRTTLQSDGRVVDKHDFTIAAYHYLEFIHRDVSILNGPRDYLVYRQYCCLPEGQLDRRCKPIPVPNDDPYLRVTDIRCMNFSRAETFQDNGCVNETISPEQINFQTPVIDLSTIYGVDEKGLDSVRLYKHGLLKLEYRDFRNVPLANLTSNPVDPISGLAMSTPQLLGNITTLGRLLQNSTALGQIKGLGDLEV
ncbi:salivary peroxidase/catechol oxidase-like [Choristoneura fumiferana]|uniref:salivary peroxidase/catechol oxidase-like n=1 Tax=Choristoneura fumiferana TaxID=7141 RepID=UPI003D156DCC